MKTKEWTQKELDEMGLLEDSERVPNHISTLPADSVDVHLSIDPSTMLPSEIVERNQKVKDNFQKKADNPDKQSMPNAQKMEEMANEENEFKKSNIGTGLGGESILRNIERLQEALEAGKYQAPPKSLTDGASLEVSDLYLPYNRMFSTAAKHAMKRRVDTMRPSRNLKYGPPLFNSLCDEVRQFAVVARGEERIELASQRIADIINELADREFITGAMCKMSIIKLVNEPHQLERYLVFSYLCLSAEGCRFLDNSDSGNDNVRPYMVREGYLPNMRV